MLFPAWRFHFQALHIVDIHAAKLAAPKVTTCFRTTISTAQIFYGNATIHLPQKNNHLFLFKRLGLGIIAGCIITGNIIFLWAYFFKSSSSAYAVTDGILFGCVASVVAIGPAYVWGAPLYALLVYKAKASYRSAAMIGGIPGLIMCFPDGGGFAQLSLIFGVAIGICTHFFVNLISNCGGLLAIFVALKKSLVRFLYF